MKKLALVLALCTFLAGCGATEVAPEEKVETPAEEITEVPQSIDQGGAFIGSVSLD